MKNAGKVIIVPGYGMAVAPAQRLSQIMSGGSSSCAQINASTINCVPDIVGDAGGIAP